MANVVKLVSSNDDIGAAEEWYLTVRCTNSECGRLIAFQKAISRDSQLTFEVAVKGDPSVDCPSCGTRVRVSSDQIERRRVIVS